jgi:DNA-binding NtrC family response regulator
LLQLYTYPGNIRELEALVYDAVARHGSGILSMESFRKLTGDDRQGTQTSVATATGDISLSDIFGHFPNIREVEEYMISESMKLAKGNQGIAASLLGMTRQTLNNRLKIAGRTE